MHLLTAQHFPGQGRKITAKTVTLQIRRGRDSFPGRANCKTFQQSQKGELTFQKQSGGASGSIAVSGGIASVTLYGIPDLPYDVQRALNADGPWTTLLASPPLNVAPPITSASDGKISFTDDFSDLGAKPGAAYYRTMQH